MATFPSRAMPRRVMAYYHPFYGTAAGPTGRWLTWNEPLSLATGYGFEVAKVPPAVQQRLAHDPEQFVGPERRSSYGAHYPLLGLYDCLDRSVLQQHAAWAAEASLDGLLWDYMLVGEDNSDRNKPLSETIYDRSFRLMLEVLEGSGARLDLCPFYDSYCWYGYPVEKIAEQLSYLVRSYHGHPCVFHLDGKLVVYLYSTFAKHSPEDWARVRELLARQGVQQRIFLVAGELAYEKPDFHKPGLFDGFSQYNYNFEDWSPEGVARISAQLRKLAGRNESAFWSTTIGPGFDGRTWHHPGRALARGLGGLYESMWRAAIAANPPVITICSFNEWGEATQIEPCLEYEDLYLRLTAKWAKQYTSR
jgi:glycoprotein endo-alpha-1,2-mannosidase